MSSKDVREIGRPSVPPERLLKAQLMMALYALRSTVSSARSPPGGDRAPMLFQNAAARELATTYVAIILLDVHSQSDHSLPRHLPARSIISASIGTFPRL